jgi:hypothetical protein
MEQNQGNERDFYTTDELLFAYKDFTKTIKYSRPMSDVFLQILCLFRADHTAKKDSYIYVSRQIIETETGFSPDQTTKYINDLISFEIIEADIKPQGYYNRSYRLKWGKSIVNHISAYRSRLQSFSSHIHDVARDNVKSVEEKITTEEPENNFTEAEQEIIVKLDKSWVEFVKIRNASEKRINKTTQGYQLLLKRLMLYSNNDIEHARQLLDYSIEKGYDDIYKREKDEFVSNGEMQHNVPLKPLKNGK